MINIARHTKLKAKDSDSSISDEYSQLIDCLSLNDPCFGTFYWDNSQIGAICRIIQQYSGKTYIKVVYTKQNGRFLRQISTALNPINSDIYVSDTLSIYKISAITSSLTYQETKIYSIIDINPNRSTSKRKGKRKHNNYNNNININCETKTKPKTTKKVKKNRDAICNIAIDHSGEKLFFQQGASEFHSIQIDSKIGLGLKKKKENQASKSKNRGNQTFLLKQLKIMTIMK